jgi:hypothetical protein
MDTCVKPIGGYFNSSFGASEYVCKDFFSLLESFPNSALATITCFSSKIYKKSKKEEQSEILSSCLNSLGLIELIRRVSKGSEKLFL